MTSYPDYIKNILGDIIHPIFTSLPLLMGCILEEAMWSHDLVAKWKKHVDDDDDAGDKN